MSLVLHALVFAAIGFRRPQGPDGPAAPPWIFAEITPRQRPAEPAARERTASAATPQAPPAALRDREGAPPLPLPGSPLADGAAADPSAPGAPTRWAVRRPDGGDRLARALAESPLACSRPPERLTAALRDACAARLARPARVLADPAQARFERDGAAALAAYDERRGSLPPGERPACEPRGPITDCEAEVRVRIFSSRDGLLPGLRAR